VTSARSFATNGTAKDTTSSVLVTPPRGSSLPGTSRVQSSQRLEREGQPARDDMLDWRRRLYCGKSTQCGGGDGVNPPFDSHHDLPSNRNQRARPRARDTQTKTAPVRRRHPLAPSPRALASRHPREAERGKLQPPCFGSTLTLKPTITKRTPPIMIQCGSSIHHGSLL
jgi:hypothetical protein